MSADLYREQVALLLRLLPIVGREEMFALKGGTAINLFVRNLPRLSVDIDLTFLPLIERDAALTAIGRRRYAGRESAHRTFQDTRHARSLGSTVRAMTRHVQIARPFAPDRCLGHTSWEHYG